MRFPESDRVRYRRNPLVEVICQLRFSRVLRIEKEPPNEVQDAVRDHYPQLDVRQGVELAFPIVGNAPPVALSRGTSYDFSSRDAQWKFVLAADFIALSTTSYTRWEEFQDRLKRLVEIVTQQYGISYFTRVGLRYQDVIVRSDLGLADTAWRELLKEGLLGMLAVADFEEEHFDEVLSVVLFRVGSEDCRCRVRHGLARKGDSPELGYLIDADFFTERQLEVNDAWNVLGDFNREAGRFFRWCVKPKLHNAMDPEPIT